MDLVTKPSPVGPHILVYQFGGQDWVRGTPYGGASTFAAPWKIKSPTSRWWVLPPGSSYSNLLTVRNDHGRHWLWEAATDMLLADYLRALRDLNKRFV
jgi:hypothetical protein